MEALHASNLFSVNGSVAVITGGGTGIGLMMTKASAANGAHKVYIVGRRKEKLDEAASHAPEIIVPVVGDVTSKDSSKSIAAQIKSEVGYLNLSVCNSGMMGPQIPVKAAEASVSAYAAAALDMAWDENVQTFATNSVSPLYTTFAFLESSDAGNKKGNRIGTKSQVSITSSIAGFSRTPGLSYAYGMSKAATTHLTKQSCSTLVPFDIRVNALAPGLFPSDSAAGSISNAKKDPTEEGAFEKSYIPAERTGKESDMGGTVLYMASQAGAYSNGVIVVIDGGRLAGSPTTY